MGFPNVMEDPQRPGVWGVWWGPGTSDKSFHSEAEAWAYIAKKRGDGKAGAPPVDKRD